jgi:hypothetical protein
MVLKLFRVTVISMVFAVLPAAGYAQPFLNPTSRLIPFPEGSSHGHLALLEETVYLDIVYFPRIFGGREIFSPAYRIKAEYRITNTGAGYAGRLGVAVVPDSGEPMPEEIRFRLNGAEQSLSWIENQPWPDPDNWAGPRGSLNYAVISVEIAAGAEAVIQAEYSNWARGAPGSMGDKLLIDYGSSVFSGLEYISDRGAKYALVLENNSARSLDMEQKWISDMTFFPRDGDAAGNLRMCYYLLEQESLDTELFRIRKTGAASWRVDFTDAFTGNYENRFSILLLSWSSTRAYAYYWSGSPMLLRVFERGSYEAKITERRLGPYEMIFLTNRQLRVMRNAFYAQYGYIFRSKELQDIFTDQTLEGFYYRPNPDFSESMLTETDRANMETIRRLETMDLGRDG